MLFYILITFIVYTYTNDESIPNIHEILQDSQSQESSTSNKLKFCDKFVGEFIQNHGNELISDTDIQNDLLIKHFYYMMTNCYEYLNNKYRNSIIDEILYDQFDWIKITRPFEFYTEHQFPLYQLTENEIEVQNIMKIERDRIRQNYLVEMKKDWIQYQFYTFGQFLENYLYLIIVGIMTIFFVSLCLAFKWIFNEMDQRDNQIKNQLKNKKLN